MDFIRELAILRQYAEFAIEAIRDEHEGNFRYYVAEMTAIANKIKDAVDDM